MTALIVLAASDAAAAPAGTAVVSRQAQRLDLPQIDDTTTPVRNGQPLALLRETYTMSELAAGGHVTIAFSLAIDGKWAMMPRHPADFDECAGAPACLLITREQWETPGLVDPVDINRVVIGHEWGHVLSAAYREQLSDREINQFNLLYAISGEECLADAIVSQALARSELPPNETDTYSVRYACDEQTEDAAELARRVLAWAGS